MSAESAPPPNPSPLPELLEARRLERLSVIDLWHARQSRERAFTEARFDLTSDVGKALNRVILVQRGNVNDNLDICPEPRKWLFSHAPHDTVYGIEKQGAQ